MRSKAPSRFRQIVQANLRGQWLGLGLAALCMLGYTAMELVSPWPVKIIFDQILLNKHGPKYLAFFLKFMSGIDKTMALMVVAAAMVAIALIRGGFAYGQLYFTSKIGYGLVHRLRCELFLHLQSLSLSFHNRARAGETITKVTSDTNVLKDVFAQTALTVGGQAAITLGMFAVMFALNWRLSLVVLASFPLVCHTFLVRYRRIKASASEVRRQQGRVAARLSEMLGAVALVQAFSREQYEQERFESESGQTLRESMRTTRLQAAASRGLEILTTAALASVVVVGSLQVLAGHMTPGDVLLFYAYVNNMYRPLRQMARQIAQISKASVSAGRISSLLAAEPETPDRPGAIAANGLHGEIAFHDVSFSYPGGPPVLRNVSFRIPAGQRAALVGASGAGKSTIVSLILRLYSPDTGAITIDGVDIRDYQRASLRGQIGVVLQDAILFGASIRENITYGKPGATEAEIESAAREAHVHDFLAELPDGYDTVIGERGCTLSGGQRQRICLARAIIRRPSILILDEPTSAVDAESAALIRQAIDRVQEGKTLVMIAHQFVGIEHFERILVLQDGFVVEEGTHGELLRRQGLYAELFRLQSVRPLDDAIVAYRGGD